VIITYKADEKKKMTQGWVVYGGKRHAEPQREMFSRSYADEFSRLDAFVKKITGLLAIDAHGNAFTVQVKIPFRENIALLNKQDARLHVGELVRVSRPSVSTVDACRTAAGFGLDLASVWHLRAERLYLRYLVRP
jgi:hypothetical protein